MGEILYVAVIGEKGNFKRIFGGEWLHLKTSRCGLTKILNLKSL
jgi:hypothetical protein